MPKIKKTTIFLFLTLVLVTVFATFPLFGDFVRERERLKAKEKELQMEKDRVDAFRFAREDLQNHPLEVSFINNALPEEHEIPSFLHHVSQMSIRHGLLFRDFGNFSISDSEEFAGLEEIEMDLYFFGSYEDFKSFIFALENSGRIAEIQEIYIPLEEDYQGRYFNFEMNVKIYSYLKPDYEQ